MNQKIISPRRDRWADWAVIGALVVALLLGTAVMALAQGQRSAYANTDAGLAVRYPQGWLLKPAEGLAFQAVDPDAGEFKTTYQARMIPITASEPLTATLALALNNLSLTRGRQEIAYRQFEIAEGRPVGNGPSMEASYAYVLKAGDLFSQRMPVVVQGLDIAVARGDQAVVFSLLAGREAFARAEPEFRRFVASAEIR